MVIAAFGSNIFGQTAPDNDDCCIEQPEPLCDLDAVLFSGWEVTVGRAKNRVLLFGYGGRHEWQIGGNELPSAPRQILSLYPLVYVTDQGRIASREPTNAQLDLDGQLVRECGVLRDGRVHAITDIGHLWSFNLPGTSTSAVSVTRAPGTLVMTPKRTELGTLQRGHEANESLRFAHVACGDMHTLGLTNVGEVYSWGSGRFGQLGHGEVVDVESPKVICALQGIRITKVVCGAWHSAVLSEDGDLYTFGWNKHGQLGVSTEEDQKFRTATPQLIEHGIPSIDSPEGDSPIIDIACGAGHTAAVTRDGRLWTCGWGKYGQLGRALNGRDSDWVYSAVKVTEGKKVSRVECGRWNTFCHVTET